MLTTSHSPVVTATAPSPTSFHYGHSRSSIAQCSPRHHAASLSAPLAQPVAGALVDGSPARASEIAASASASAPTSTSASASSPTASWTSTSGPSQTPRRRSHQKLFSQASSSRSGSGSGSGSPPVFSDHAASASISRPLKRPQYATTKSTSPPTSRPENREMEHPEDAPHRMPESHSSTTNSRISTPSPSQPRQQQQHHAPSRATLNPTSPAKRRNPSAAPPGPRNIPHATAPHDSCSASTPQHQPSVRDPDSPSKRARAETRPKVLPIRYETMEVEDLVVLISHMLGELIATNDPMALTSGRLTRFHSRTAPGISVRDYLHRIAKHATLTPAVLLSMVYYIDRLCSLYPEFTINTLTVHRFLITAATVGAKGLSDSFWNNTTYARVGGVRVQELKTLELEFLNRVDWKIVPQPEVLVAYYKGLIKRCPNYVLEEEPESSSAADTNATTMNHDSSSGGDSSQQDGGDSTEISDDEEDAGENPEMSRAQSETGSAVSADRTRRSTAGSTENIGGG